MKEFTHKKEDTDDYQTLLKRVRDLEKQLSESENEVKNATSFIDNASFPVFQLSKNGQITYYNQASNDVLIELHKDKDLMNSVVQDVLKAAKKGKKTISVTIDRNDYEINITDVSDEHVFINFRDQTEITQAEKITHLFKRRYENLFEKNLSGVFRATLDDIFVDCNDAFAKILGFQSREDVIGKHARDLYSKVEEKADFVDSVMEDGAIENVETRIRLASGKKLWVMENANITYTIDNEPKFIDGTIIDVTRQKLALEALKESERKYRDIFENMYDSMLICDDRGNVLDWNRAVKNLLGYSNLELHGLNISQVVMPEDHIKLKEYFILLLEKGRFEGLELRVYNKSGELKFLEINSSAIYENDAFYGSRNIIRDVTERKKINNQIKRSEEKYRNLIENMDFALVEVDVNGVIHSVYKRMCDLTGYSKQELIGRKLEDLLLEEVGKATVARQKVLSEDGDGGVYELKIRHKKGNYLWVMVSGRPSYDENNVLTGYLGIFVDISEQKRVQQELKGANRKAEESVKAKEIFLANMSHEIRTPMNAITGMGRLLLQTDLNIKQKEYVEAIRKSGENLLVIINDILDFSKIDAGKIELEEVDFNLRKMLDDVIATLAYKAEQRGILLTLEVDADIPAYLKGDPVRLFQILTNLINNSIKFTNEGEVKLTCVIADDKEKIKRVELSVADSGIGIDKDKLESIFDSFTQEDSSTTRKFGGTGLGLAISKRLVEYCGGELKVHSIKGVGTIFSFEIDFLVGKKITEVIETHEPFSEEEIQGIKVLLVEDHEINRFLAQTILQGWKMDVDYAVNGKEAVDKIRNNEFDVVLMDMQMPEMGGVEATRIIRNELKNKVPIVALTANAIKGDKEKYLAEGMNDYISKPFDPSDLYNTILEQVRSQPKNETINENGPNAIVEKPIELNLPKQTTTMELKIYGITTLEKVSGGNKEFIKKMMELFVGTTPGFIQEIKEAMSQNEYHKVGTLAHKIKPSIDNMEINTLKEEIRIIESSGKNLENLDELSKRVSYLEEELNRVIDQVSEDLVKLS